MMFNNKVLNISFLISLGWHLLCIFLFALVITPKGFSLNKFPETSFLGPILETGTFQSGYNIKETAMVTPYKEDFATGGALVDKQYNYFDSQVLLDENLEKAQFIELTFEKQAPPLDIPQHDKD